MKEAKRRKFPTRSVENTEIQHRGAGPCQSTAAAPLMRGQRPAGYQPEFSAGGFGEVIG